MKKLALCLLALITLSACAPWNLDKPIDEETEKERKGNTQPAAVNFF